MRRPQGTLDQDEKLVRQLYRIKLPTKRIQNMVDDLSMELVGETYPWPKNLN